MAGVCRWCKSVCRALKGCSHIKQGPICLCWCHELWLEASPPALCPCPCGWGRARLTHTRSHRARVLEVICPKCSNVAALDLVKFG